MRLWDVLKASSYARGVPVLAAFAIAISAQAVFAQGAGAVVPLPPEVAAAAEKYLPGVIGEAVPAFTIDPALASLHAGTRSYTIVSGEGKGTTERHVVVAAREVGQWRYTVGDRTVFLREIKGESLGIVTEEDTDQGVMTRFSPAEPLLIAGMNVGDKKKVSLKVDVFDLDDPDDLEHKGTLDVTLSYVGAYKVTVPAGRYDAALLRWDFHGKIGPAKIDDIQVRLVAKDVGMVAAAEKRDIAAMLIYNDQTKVGKVLQQE